MAVMRAWTLAACVAVIGSSARAQNVARDLVQSAAFDDRACKLGEARSCSLLASDYQFGQGVGRDAQRAKQLYEKACVGGDSMGCDNLDKPFLAQLRETMCVQNNWEACADLAGQYEHSQGVVEDMPHAAQLYDRACANGHGRSCYALSELYQGGLGVRQNVKHADDLAAAACHSGYQRACRR
jgi:uncharacterized protein